MTAPERDDGPSEHTVYKATKTRDVRAKEQLVIETAIAWAAERSWRKRTDDEEGRHLAAIDELLLIRQRTPVAVGERVRVHGHGAGALKALPRNGTAVVDLDDGTRVHVSREMVRRL